MPDGTRQGFGPGYPSTRQLERSDFVRLEPGRVLRGIQDVEVFPTPAGTIELRGEYRSGQNGLEFGLSAWVGEVMSEAVTIRVPKQ